MKVVESTQRWRRGTVTAATVAYFVAVIVEPTTEWSHSSGPDVATVQLRATVISSDVQNTIFKIVFYFENTK